MTYYLSRHITLCDCTGAAIALDEKRDRYIQLSPRANAAIAALRSGAIANNEDVSRLLRLGLITADQHCGKPFDIVEEPVPVRSLLECERMGERRAPAWLVAEVGVRLIFASLALKLRPLHVVLGRVRSRRSATSVRRQDDDHLRSAALRFDAARSTIPVSSVCLPDSLALLEYLESRKLSGYLVIGVKRHPFAAHCWVQTDKFLLNETVDTASLYTPIAVIR